MLPRFLKAPTPVIFGAPVHHRANSRSHILPTSQPLGKPFFLYFKNFTAKKQHFYRHFPAFFELFRALDCINFQLPQFCRNVVVFL